MRTTTSAALLLLTALAFGQTQFDHSLWNELLQAHVNVHGMVDYQGMKADERLPKYIAALGAAHPEKGWLREEQMVFWINAYNAFTVKLIVDNYPQQSITDLKEPWQMLIVKLKGKTYTLDQVENEVLRPQFNDPRIHYALNCASFSCPPLYFKAFMAEELEQQLEHVAHAFINDPKRNQLGSEQAEISRIYEWYASDFEVDGGVIAHINKYARGAVSPKANITFMEYDWKLNEQKK